MRQRGARGILGLKRIFKIMDDDGSGFLDAYEFNKGLKDYRVTVDESQKGQLFKLFDLNGCLLYTSPSPRDLSTSRMPSSA